MNPFQNTISAANCESLQGNFTWQSPSNIALVKYWGKRPIQLPQNPSISFTLSKAFSETQIEFEVGGANKGIENLQFALENKENETFRKKIIIFFQSVVSAFPFLPEISLRINSFNSFPHSAGIASSASGMSALVLGLVHIEQILRKNTNIELLNEANFFQKASYFARLASGSACRSIYGGSVLWGETSALPNSSDDFAVPVPSIHSVFEDFQDTILIVSKAEKSVSSRSGHSLMDSHPFADIRYQTARQNISLLLQVLRIGDLEKFVELVENEALTLHSLMMTSNPSVLLLQGGTLEMIHRIRRFRTETKIPVSFTIDAGPNIHLLYPRNDQKAVKSFIETELKTLCQNEQMIFDEVGKGVILKKEKK